MAYSLFRITEYDSNASWNIQQSLFFRQSVLKMTHLEQKSISTRKLIQGKLTVTPVSSSLETGVLLTKKYRIKHWLFKTE